MWLVPAVPCPKIIRSLPVKRVRSARRDWRASQFAHGRRCRQAGQALALPPPSSYNRGMTYTHTQYGRFRQVRESTWHLRLICPALEISFALLVKPVEVAEHFFFRIFILCTRNAERWFRDEVGI